MTAGSGREKRQHDKAHSKAPYSRDDDLSCFASAHHAPR